MKQKQTKKFVSEEEAPSSAPASSIAAMTISANLFYGTFLSIAILIAGLLYADGSQISAMKSVTPQGNIRQMVLEGRVSRLVAGFPIEQMTDIISKQNKTTAAFLVGIAKKESNWGKRVPRADDGTDCFNYWGYRGAGSRGIAMGHGCFGSPEEAVGVVGGRLDTLVNEYHFRTAQDLIVWKCGWSCDGHSSQSVKKWISDVGYYTKKITN